MAEAQSRYSIMNELNAKKIKVREELAELEQRKDKTVYKIENKIEHIKRELEDKNNNYVRDHDDWKRQELLKKHLLDKQLQREIDNISSEIVKRDKNYQEDHNKWKYDQENLMKEGNDELTKYNNEMKKLISTKHIIIKEIEEGVNSLKEISKESSKE